jgi:hypothetical protein
MSFEDEEDSSFRRYRDGVFVPRRIGYTTVQNRLKWFRQQLALHRRNKRTWRKSMAEFETEENRLKGRVSHYAKLLKRSDYAAQIRKARNRNRRKKRPWIQSRKANIISDLLRGRGKDEELRVRLQYVVLQIRRKHFKTKQTIARRFKKPMSWVETLLEKVADLGLMTAEEIKEKFRGPGRPRKGKTRGPYKTKIIR